MLFPSLKNPMAWLWLATGPAWCGVTWKTESAAFAIDDRGHVTSITRRSDGRDFLATNAPAPVLQLRVNGAFHAPDRRSGAAVVPRLRRSDESSIPGPGSMHGSRQRRGAGLGVARIHGQDGGVGMEPRHHLFHALTRRVRSSPHKDPQGGPPCGGHAGASLPSPPRLHLGPRGDAILFTFNSGMRAIPSLLPDLGNSRRIDRRRKPILQQTSPRPGATSEQADHPRADILGQNPPAMRRTLA